jgi:predicted metal-binding protein
MIRFCDCNFCKKKQEIKNSYDIYEKNYLIDDVNIDFDVRVAALCKYDCSKYNKKATCPPVIPGFEYYRRALMGYKNICVIGRRYPYSDGLFIAHWRKYSTNEIHYLLLQKETELFRSGFVYAKSFIGGSCKYCESSKCGPDRCSVPSKGRVPLEGTGINVYSLMKSIALPFQEPPEEYFWRIGCVFY